jgi:hypothetical protein
MKSLSVTLALLCLGLATAGVEAADTTTYRTQIRFSYAPSSGETVGEVRARGDVAFGRITARSPGTEARSTASAGPGGTSAESVAGAAPAMRTVPVYGYDRWRRHVILRWVQIPAASNVTHYWQR